MFNLKVPPHDDMAERATISALLLNNDALEDIVKYLRPKDFYQPAHSLVFQAILNILNRGECADVISVQAELKKLDLFEKVGGLQKLNELANEVSSSANVEHYAKLVHAASLRRTIMTTGAKMAEAAMDDSRAVRAILEEAEESLFALSESSYSKGFIQLGSIYTNMLSQLGELRALGVDALPGVSTGFVDIDNMLGGFKKSEYILIGARPSIGKTALALQFALNAGLKAGVPVGFCSLEMPAMDLLKRMVAQFTGVTKLRKPAMLTAADMSKIKAAGTNFAAAPIYVNDTSNMKMLDLKTEARKMKRQHDIQVLFVDYIGLVTAELGKGTPRHEEVSAISRSMKSLARELEIPVVCLAQVGRAAETKPPTLAELRDSGSLEQDADVVMFLHRDRSEQATVSSGPDADGYQPHGQVSLDVNVAKNRNGPVGTISLYFDPARTAFYDSTASADDYR